MKRKLIVVSILMLLISTATILPVANSSTASILINKSGKNDEMIMDSSSHDEEIEQLYEQFKHKIYSKHDPSMEVKKLLSYPEIQDEIKELSDRNTFQAINMLFSNSTPLIKK